MPKIGSGLSERLRLLPPRSQQAVIQRWCEKLYFMRQEVTAAKHTADWDHRQTHTLFHSYITLRWGDVQCVCVWGESFVWEWSWFLLLEFEGAEVICDLQPLSSTDRLGARIPRGRRWSAGRLLCRWQTPFFPRQHKHCQTDTSVLTFTESFHQGLTL